MAQVRIKYAKLDELNLDPLNPRLGRNLAKPNTKQDKILEVMNDWTLDELAVSFIESGFWPQEALIVVEEPIYGRPGLVVVEGNRRLAALLKLKQALDGDAREKKWREIATSAGNLSAKFFEEIPYILVPNRQAVSAFLGFRHVTGIKEWDPAEKAQFIAQLIEQQGLSYEEVMRKIGSKTPTVRSHYIAYRLLLQLEDTEGVAIDKIEDKFSVLYLSLRTGGVQKYLGVDIKADPSQAKFPVAAGNEQKLANYATWMFGDEKRPPLFSDSRNIDKFGRMLLSSDAVAYLEGSENPNFDFALKKAGGDTEEVVSLLSQAADSVEIAFSTLHMHQDDKEVLGIAKRLSLHLVQMTKIFPELRKLVQEKV
ncbi:hypothetical protein VSO52_15790 [Pseudomonas fulva]|uniref:hypothetical protein n=1 Tax=Pseudomonas fulva TaxID=47880 RepID=UPI002DBEAB2E|nr:hypothetical protein [Pseudomonas fulva]MEC4024246.1 hypothetical protein [Pseudomonas fulva]